MGKEKGSEADEMRRGKRRSKMGEEIRCEGSEEEEEEEGDGEEKKEQEEEGGGEEEKERFRTFFHQAVLIKGDIEGRLFELLTERFQQESDTGLCDGGPPVLFNRLQVDLVPP